VLNCAAASSDVAANTASAASETSEVFPLRMC
jgi:hypothetical protein